jgi:hypothetical protein
MLFTDVDVRKRGDHERDHGQRSPGVTDVERLRELLHGVSSDDRDERRPWAGTPGDWWREGSLDRQVASTVGTVLTWCAMVDDDAGGVRAALLGSLAALAEDGQVPEGALDRLVTGLDAQWIPDSERPHSETLRSALGRQAGRRDRKGYLWMLVDHVHALTSPDGAQREAATSAAGSESGIAADDAHALAVVIDWATR